MELKFFLIRLNIIFIYTFIFLSSCEKSNDSINNPTTKNTTNEPTDHQGLKFKKTTQKYTLNVCDQQFCSSQQVTFLNENIGFLVTGVDVYKTNNGGEEWINIKNQDIVGQLIPLSEDLMFLNTYEGILKTNNTGKSWSTIDRPLEFICQESGSINPGSIAFVDESNGFIQDRCYKGQLYKTTDSGNSWKQIYNSTNDISEYHFEDKSNGFIIVDDTLYVTQNGGNDWLKRERLPNNFDYVIEKQDFFMFPEGKSNINKPNLDIPNTTITNYHVNENGDIAIIVKNSSSGLNNYKLMLHENKEDSKWITIDELSDLTDKLSYYTDIHLTNKKSIYVCISRVGYIIKYSIE